MNRFDEQIRSENRQSEKEWRAVIENLRQVTRPTLRDQPWTGKSSDDSSIVAVCRYLCLREKLPFTEEPHKALAGNEKDPLGALSRASNFRIRGVVLEGPWWKTESGPMIAYLAGDHRPVALFYERAHYRCWDPVTQTEQRVDHAFSRKFLPNAYALYRPFPASRLRLRDLLDYGLFRSYRDLGILVLLTFLAGLLGLASPLLTKTIFDDIIPNAERGQMTAVMLLLMATAVTSSLLMLTSRFALLRIESRADASIQNALWDRLMALPATFFRRFTVGDLATRADSLQQIRRVLTGATITTAMHSAFSLVQLYVIFRYGKGWLVAWGFGAVAITLLAITVSGWITVTFERKILHEWGRLAGLTFQLLSGIAKLKITGSEERGFVRWIHQYSYLRRLSFKAAFVQSGFNVYHAAFAILASMVTFALAFHEIKSPGSQMTTGDFLAYSAAFGTLSGAMLGMGSAAISLLHIIPMWERAKPIIEEKPEIEETRQQPAVLEGAIEVHDVWFRYEANHPDVLRGVSLRAKPGEFVAVVGASGSGKSTLLRMLLGFDTPRKGSVLYDSMDLARVDPRGIRKQIGTVLQDGKLLQGDILSNIIGANPLGEAEAWRAAERAGLADDIRALPMGMRTVVAEGASTLSGGQRQRLLIARALVTEPKIVYFDEATSALDNHTQRIVSDSLDQMRATRLVIAHRLSTIRHADRIHVMDSGTIVEAGTFEEHRMAKRQIS